MTPDTDVAPIPAASITQWDDEADVASAGYMLMKPLVDTATAAGIRAI